MGTGSRLAVVGTALGHWKLWSQSSGLPRTDCFSLRDVSAALPSDLNLTDVRGLFCVIQLVSACVLIRAYKPASVKFRVCVNMGTKSQAVSILTQVAGPSGFPSLSGLPMKALNVRAELQHGGAS